MRAAARVAAVEEPLVQQPCAKNWLLRNWLLEIGTIKGCHPVCHPAWPLLATPFCVVPALVITTHTLCRLDHCGIYTCCMLIKPIWHLIPFES